jgi:hypothetical protein
MSEERQMSPEELLAIKRHYFEMGFLRACISCGHPEESVFWRMHWEDRDRGSERVKAAILKKTK